MGGGTGVRTEKGKTISFRIADSGCGCGDARTGTGSASFIGTGISGTPLDTNSEPSDKAADSSNKNRFSRLLICRETRKFTSSTSEILCSGDSFCVAGSSTTLLDIGPLMAAAIIRYIDNRIMVAKPSTGDSGRLMLFLQLYRYSNDV
jgi:hypothetical protein